MLFAWITISESESFIIFRVRAIVKADFVSLLRVQRTFFVFFMTLSLFASGDEEGGGGRTR